MRTRGFEYLQVLEETGFDISDLIDPNEFVEYKLNEQQSRLYVVQNVPMNSKFMPRTRREIRVSTSKCFFAI